MLAMNSPIPTSKPRRFLLLPEQQAGAKAQGIRIRRYRLVKVSPRVPSSE